MPDIAIVNGLEIREMAGREGVDGLQTGSASRSWLIKGADDPLLARAALLSDNLTLYDVWKYDGLRLESLSRQRIGPEAWEFTGEYGDFPARGEYKISIDTTGGVVKTTHAFAQTAFAATGETATNYGLAVDVQEGEARGVDIIVPALKLSVMARIDFGLLTNVISYAKLVASLTGQTNATEFLEFAPGELLFAGATGPIIDDKDPTLNFEFLASSNLSGVTIGNIANVTKAGHDYAWVSHRRDVDGSSGRQTLTPVAMYVARVYGQGDFDQLGIGQLAV